MLLAVVSGNAMPTRGMLPINAIIVINYRSHEKHKLARSNSGVQTLGEFRRQDMRFVRLQRMEEI
jgi:hypothetical protein